MGVYSVRKVQRLPVTLQQAWDFFSSPANLQNITPASMGFNIISKHHGEKMYAGQLIEYKVRPLFNIPVYWMTEITHVVDQKYFVDEQRYGPYSMWHHQHFFQEIEGGVEMIDLVHYKIPYWFIGDIANALFVQKKVEDIFDYRKVKVEELFGKF
jgi:ligand-binding SRPBCC domain-containing protein